MISIERVYNTVRDLLNTHTRGNIDPYTIRTLINQAVNEIYDSLFSNLNMQVNKQNRWATSNIAQLVPNAYECINYYYTTADMYKMTTDTYFTLPTDVRHIQSFQLEDGTEVERVYTKNEFRTAKRYASETFPIAYTQENQRVELSSNITHHMQVHYYRKHKIANYTFTEIQGTELYNPSSPYLQEIDMHPSLEHLVILTTLKYAGLNLRDNDVQQFSQTAKAQDVQIDTQQ